MFKKITTRLYNGTDIVEDKVIINTRYILSIVDNTLYVANNRTLSYELTEESMKDLKSCLEVE